MECSHVYKCLRHFNERKWTVHLLPVQALLSFLLAVPKSYIILVQFLITLPCLCTSDWYLQRKESIVTSYYFNNNYSLSKGTKIYVVVALYRILHPETTCLLWPVHIGPWVVASDRFHCIVRIMLTRSTGAVVTHTHTHTLPLFIYLFFYIAV